MSRQLGGGVVLTVFALMLTSLGTKSTNRSPGNDLHLVAGLILIGCSVLFWIVIAIQYSRMAGKPEPRGFEVIDKDQQKKFD